MLLLQCDQPCQHTVITTMQRGPNSSSPSTTTSDPGRGLDKVLSKSFLPDAE